MPPRPSPRPVTGYRTKAPNAEPIWVFGTGWHTGLILDRQELQGESARLRTLFPGAGYLMFGWGDRAYYMAHNPSSGTAIAALFPSKSTILVQPCDAPLPDCLPEPSRLDKLMISPTGMGRIDAYINATIKTDEAGRPLFLGPGPGMGGAFFASGRTYDAFHTCNSWTAQALHWGGLPVSSRGVIFAWQVWNQLGRTIEQQDKTAASR